MGNVVRNTTLSLAVALACAGSNWAHALSLGEIRVHSHLAEPFRAEINLPVASPTELEELSIQLAPDAIFEQAGLDRAELVGMLKFSLQRRPDGSPYIWIESADAVKDLGLSFFVEARWRGGNLVRGYDILLNPVPHRIVPRVVAAPLASPKTPAATPKQEAPAAPTPVVAAEPAAPTQSASRPELGPRPSRDMSRVAKPDEKGVSFGPTLPGDTLGDIARRIDPELRFTRAQLIGALVQENPQAFAAGDANRLKAGYTLHIGDIANVPALASQYTQAGKFTAKAILAPASGGNARAETDAVPAPTEAAPATPAAANKPKQLAIETTAGGAVDSRAALEENIAATRSEIAATKQAAQTLQSENEALRKRIAELEKQVVVTAETALKPAEPAPVEMANTGIEIPAQPSAAVTVGSTPAMAQPPAMIEDFGLVFGAVAAITLLLLGFLGMRPESREKIAEFWRTKIRREPAIEPIAHTD